MCNALNDNLSLSRNWRAKNITRMKTFEEPFQTFQIEHNLWKGFSTGDGAGAESWK